MNGKRQRQPKSPGKVPVEPVTEEQRRERVSQYSEFVAAVELSLARDFGVDREAASKLLTQLKSQPSLQSNAGKRQLAILFSFIEQSAVQPTDEIASLLAEVENRTVASVQVVDGGRGYDKARPPVVRLPQPFVAAADGSAPTKNNVATAAVQLRPTGQVLRIDVTNGGKGYAADAPPKVLILRQATDAKNETTSTVEAQAVAVVQDGAVAGVRMTASGSGYGSTADQSPPLVKIEPPPAPTNGASSKPIAATAVAVLDQQVESVLVKNSGFGYTAAQSLEAIIEFLPERTTAATGSTTPAPTPITASGGGAKPGPPANATPALASAQSRAAADADRGVLTTPTAATLNVVLSDPYPLPSSTAAPAIDWGRAGAGTPIATLTALLPGNLRIALNADGMYRVEGVDASEANRLDPIFPRNRSPVEKEKALSPSSFSLICLSGALCASVSHVLLTPFELVKTRMQVSPGDFSSAPECAGAIVKEKGLAGLFSGADTIALGFFVQGGVAFGFTDLFRRLGVAYAGGEGRFEALGLPVEVALVVGSLIAGAAATIAVAPFEAVRVRLQATEDGDSAESKENVLSAVAALVEEYGVKDGLYAGVPPLLLKEITFSIIKFPVFDVVRNVIFVLNPNLQAALSSALFVSMVSGSVAGVLAAVASQPLDTLFTRVSSRKAEGASSAASPAAMIASSFSAVMQEDGPVGLFRGVGSRSVFCGTLLALEFLIYDFLRTELHVSAGDLKLTLDVLGGVRESAAAAAGGVG